MRNSVLIAALILTTSVCTSLAKQPKTSSTSVAVETKVFVGQSLDDAKKALLSRKIDLERGPFAFYKRDPDDDYMTAVIDKHHTQACIWYSKSKSRVTEVWIMFRPYLQAGGAHRTSLPATDFVLHEDRSYSVKFKPPLTDEEIKKFEQDHPPQHPPGFANPGK